MDETRRDVACYLLFLLALAGIATTCFSLLRQPAEGLAERAARTGAIRLAYSPEAPYAFLTPDGRITGAWPEIARKVLQRMGVSRTEWVQGEFGLLLDDLNAGRCDIVASGMIINPERQERATFSLPVAQIEAGLLVRKGNPDRLRGYVDAAQRPELRVAVIQGAVEEELLRGFNARSAQILAVPDARSGLAAVKGGQAAALALTRPTLQYMAALETDVEAIAAYPADADAPPAAVAGFVFRHSDADFVKAFNRQLRLFLNSPDYAATIRPFGFSGNVPPLPDLSPEDVHAP